MYKLLALAVAIIAHAEAFSTGAPESTCVDMIPKHPVAPQKSAAPYVVTTNTKVVKAGTPMEVVISGKGSANTIRGLLVQARAGDQPIGQFTVPPGNPYAQLLNCGQPGNAVTHKKHSEPDPQTIALTWTPPAGFNGEIKFRSTIALNGEVFWVGVESAPVKVTN